MKTVNDKIKELRTQKSFSQQELADKSGLSLRTIQRIESGESEPTPHSVRQICEALGIKPDELYEYHKIEDESKIQFLHLSVLAGLIVPFGNVLGPLLYWTYNKKKYEKLDQHAKNLLLFQLFVPLFTVLFLLLLGLIISKFSPDFRSFGLMAFPFLLVIYVFFVLVYPVICTLVINSSGVKNFYPVIFKK